MRPAECIYLNPFSTSTSDQSNYLEVTQTKEQAQATLINPDASPLVSAVAYRMGRDFVQGVYDSCKDVVNPSTSSSVFGLLCGPWGDLCTPQRLLDFLGDVKNGRTPFAIDFQLKEDADPAAFSPEFVQCHLDAPDHGLGEAEFGAGGGGA